MEGTTSETIDLLSLFSCIKNELFNPTKTVKEKKRLLLSSVKTKEKRKETTTRRHDGLVRKRVKGGGETPKERTVGSPYGRSKDRSHTGSCRRRLDCYHFLQCFTVLLNNHNTTGRKRQELKERVEKWLSV